MSEEDVVKLRERIEWAAMLFETGRLTESEWNEISEQVTSELRRRSAEATGA